MTEVYTDVQLLSEILKSEERYLPKETKKSYIDKSLLGWIEDVIDVGWDLSIVLQDFYEYQRKREFEIKVKNTAILTAESLLRKESRGLDYIQEIPEVAQKLEPIIRAELLEKFETDVYYPKQLLTEIDQISVIRAGAEGFLIQALFGKFKKQKSFWRRRREEEGEE